MNTRNVNVLRRISVAALTAVAVIIIGVSTPAGNARTPGATYTAGTPAVNASSTIEAAGHGNVEVDAPPAVEVGESQTLNNTAPAPADHGNATAPTHNVAENNAGVKLTTPAANTTKVEIDESAVLEKPEDPVYSTQPVDGCYRDNMYRIQPDPFECPTADGTTQPAPDASQPDALRQRDDLAQTDDFSAACKVREQSDADNQVNNVILCRLTGN